MCGIVGYISKRGHGLYRRDVDLIEQMLIFNMVRGKDSTGVFCRKSNGDIIGTKTATHPLHLLLTKQWDDFGKEAVATGRFIIGHGRAATRGEVKNDNAHPFVENNIILVHNGTLRQTSNITDVSTEVDSHAIAHALTEKTPQEVLKELNGAFALVWYNTETATLHAVRNDERPLWILEEGEDGYIICSEDWIGGIPAARQDRKITGITQVEPGDLYTWDATAKNKMSVERVSLRPDTYASHYPMYGQHVRGRTSYTPPSSAGQTTSEATKQAVEGQQQKDENFQRGSDETPEEITRLRERLAQRAASKTTQSSKDCALTSPLGTAALVRSGQATSTTIGNPKTASTGMGCPSEEDRAVERTASIATFRPDLQKGSPVLFKIIGISPEPSAGGRFKYHGKIREPGKEMVDCIGFLPRSTSVLELPKYINDFWFGLVYHTTHTTNGGCTVLLNSDIFPANMEQVHGEAVPQSVVWRAVDHEICDCCGRSVKLWERSYTSIRLKGKIGVPTPTGSPMNVIEMTCAECMADKMTKGSEFRKQFEEKYAKAREVHESTNSSSDRAGSVSSGQSQRPSTGGTNGNVVALSSKKTLH